MRRAGRILAVFNQMGGSGKTTVARDLGQKLAKRRYRVLLVDVDPHADLSQWLGVTDAGDDQTLLRLLSDGVPPQPISTFGMALIPSNHRLKKVDNRFAIQPGGDRHLRDVLTELAERYDVVLLDSPPCPNKLSHSCGLASDGIIVPIEATPKGLQRAQDLLELAN